MNIFAASFSGLELLIYALFGLVFGSFFNVVIIRINKQSIVFPASYCDECKSPLKWYHNIPLISWLMLRGKCSFCSKSISIQYPIVELLGMLAFMLAKCIVFYDDLQAVLLGLCLCTLIALSVIDLKYKAVPESLLLLSLVLGLASSYDLLFISSLKHALIFAGAIVLLKSFLSFFKNLGKDEILEPMGDADIIIIALIGALLGPLLGCFAIFLGSVLTLPFFLYLRIKGLAHNYEMPFIPFLSMGFVISLALKLPLSILLSSHFAVFLA